MSRVRSHESSRKATPLIVHVIYALGTGGLENGLVNLINRCPPSRYRHAVICLSDAQLFARRITAPVVEIIELGKKPGHDLAMYWRLWRHLRRLQPAIIHTRNLAALETQALGVLMPRCRRVHGEHGRDMADLDGSNAKYRLLRLVLSPLIQRFIAVSQDLAQWLITVVGIPQEKVVQIYNGVDQQRFRPRPGSGEALAQGVLASAPGGFFCTDCRVLGTVGRLAAVKDQAAIVTALASLLRARPRLRATLRLLIVGEGPQRAALESAITTLGLSDCVWLCGDRDDVPELLRCMDVFVLSSLAEGISNTVLEAMASGLPVIATRTGGNPELVEQGVSGLLVEVGDVDGLARAIESLVTDPARCRSLGRAARCRVERDFDWQRTVARYLDVYDGILRDAVREPHPAGL
ncbi:MAG: TIGR03088 family PEP-CTERM/XrtA system glycosyltransferase [Porticoccaceae bacterium]